MDLQLSIGPVWICTTSGFDRRLETLEEDGARSIWQFTRAFDLHRIRTVFDHTENDTEEMMIWKDQGFGQ